MHQKFSDKEIIEGIRGNKNEVIEFIYRENFPSISYYIFNNNGSEQDAKDICQEAIILFYEKVKEDDLVLNCSIRTYLYAVSKRLWLKRLYFKSKHIGRIDEFELLFSEEEDIEAESREIEFKQMDEALGRLGEPCKSLIEDFYLKKLSLVEIKEKYNYTNTDNAKNQKYKCLVRLKKLFFSN